MQDYNYQKGTMAVTFEVSCCMYPLERNLVYLWDQNMDSMVDYLLQAHQGETTPTVNTSWWSFTKDFWTYVQFVEVIRLNMLDGFYS